MTEITEEAKILVELEVRRAIAQEATAYREYMQSHFTLATWAGGAILVLAGVAFYFLFGQTSKEITEEVRATVTAKMNDYFIEKELSDRLSALIGAQIASAVASDSTATLISNAVSEAVTAKVTAEADMIIDQKVAQLASSLQRDDPAALLGRMLNGAVVAFTSGTCPEGWIQYAPGNGRFLLGAASAAAIGQQGGSDSIRLTVENLPAHQHDTQLGTLGAIWGLGEVKGNAIAGSSAGSFATALTSPAGMSAPLSILPPYSSVWFCQKA